MEKEKLQPQHRDVIASDTGTCMMTRYLSTCVGVECGRGGQKKGYPLRR